MIRSIFDLTPRMPDPEFRPRMMMTDITETETSYKLEVDLPGFKKDEVNVEYEEGWLIVSAERACDKEEKDDKGKVLRRERRFGSCKRRFSLSEDVDHDAIEANFADGLLTITVPKKEPTPPLTKKIDIK